MYRTKFLPLPLLFLFFLFNPHVPSPSFHSLSGVSTTPPSHPSSQLCQRRAIFHRVLPRLICLAAVTSRGVFLSYLPLWPLLRNTPDVGWYCPTMPPQYPSALTAPCSQTCWCYHPLCLVSETPSWRLPCKEIVYNVYMYTAVCDMTEGVAVARLVQ